MKDHMRPRRRADQRHGLRHALMQIPADMVEQERRQRRDRRPSLIGEDPLRHEIEKCEGRREQPIFQKEEARQRRPGHALHRPEQPFVKRRLLQHIAGLERLRENVGGDVVLRQIGARSRAACSHRQQAVEQPDGDDAGEARTARRRPSALPAHRGPQRALAPTSLLPTTDGRTARVRLMSVLRRKLRLIGTPMAYGSSTVEPVVSLDSRSWCARAASASG